MITTNYYIITGGPGMGKTAVINALRAAGHTCVPESGRDIIQQQLAAGGDQLPWADRSGFARLMAARAVNDYLDMRGNRQPVFFDRGLPDVTGYLRLCELPLPGDIAMVTEDLRYNPTVFITPPWAAIFRNDTERKQTFDEAVRTYDAMRRIYAGMGYRLVELPEASVVERMKAVLQAVR